MNDDVVILEDACINHAVAAHLQREQLVGSPEQILRLETSLVRLLGKDRLPRRHLAEDGNAVALAGRHCPHTLEPARNFLAAAQLAVSLESVQVVTDAIG